jgi:hypothetical protein
MTAGSDFSADTRLWQSATFLGFRLGVKRQSLVSIAQRVVDVVAGREATGKIGKPDADGLVRPSIFNDGDIVGHSGSR